MNELLRLLQNPKIADLLVDWNEPFSRLSDDELRKLQNACEYLRGLDCFNGTVEAFLRGKQIDISVELHRRSEARKPSGTFYDE